MGDQAVPRPPRPGICLLECSLYRNRRCTEAYSERRPICHLLYRELAPEAVADPTDKRQDGMGRRQLRDYRRTKTHPERYPISDHLHSHLAPEAVASVPDECAARMDRSAEHHQECDGRDLDVARDVDRRTYRQCRTVGDEPYEVVRRLDHQGGRIGNDSGDGRCQQDQSLPGHSFPSGRGSAFNLRPMDASFYGDACERNQGKHSEGDGCRYRGRHSIYYPE